MTLIARGIKPRSQMLRPAGGESFAPVGQLRVSRLSERLCCSQHRCPDPNDRQGGKSKETESQGRCLHWSISSPASRRCLGCRHSLERNSRIGRGDRERSFSRWCALFDTRRCSYRRVLAALDECPPQFVCSTDCPQVVLPHTNRQVRSRFDLAFCCSSCNIAPVWGVSRRHRRCDRLVPHESHRDRNGRWRRLADRFSPGLARYIAFARGESYRSTGNPARLEIFGWHLA